jgi:hypothetical protein
LRKIAILSVLALLGGIANVAAEIPYVMINGFEEVDYDKLNPIEGFKLPDSGQFRDSTWVHGEDADYVRNPPSYTLMHDDEIIYDNNTKLMWERNLNFRSKGVVPPKGEPMAQDIFYPTGIEPRRRPYHEGVQYCKTLQLGGYDDWRMPSIKEGHTIANYGSARPTIHQRYFKDVFAGLPGFGDRGKGGMWVGPIAPDHPNSGWHLGLIDGHIMGYPRGGYKTTRCVRSDNNGVFWLPNLVDNGDDTITDSFAQLMWVRNVPTVAREWEEAIQYCEDLSFAGHDDWKLPSNKEQTSMVDYRKMKPSLDEKVFPNTDYKAFYWSRTNETRDASRNLMSDTTVQPEDIEINNANENAFAQSYMLGANWRAPRRGFRALARCVRWLD